MKLRITFQIFRFRVHWNSLTPFRKLQICVLKWEHINLGFFLYVAWGTGTWVDNALSLISDACKLNCIDVCTCSARRSSDAGQWWIFSALLKKIFLLLPGSILRRSGVVRWRRRPLYDHGYRDTARWSYYDAGHPIQSLMILLDRMNQAPLDRMSKKNWLFVWERWRKQFVGNGWRWNNGRWCTGLCRGNGSTNINFQEQSKLLPSSIPVCNPLKM